MTDEPDIRTTPEMRERFHRVLLASMRDQGARDWARYDGLPWWRKLVTRKPKPRVGAGFTIEWLRENDG